MINTEQLRSALAALDAITPSRTTMPILNNLLFELGDNKLKITATDLETALTMMIDAHKSKEFACCVPSSELKQIVQTVREPQVEFELTEKYLILHDGKHKTKFKYFSKDEYPLHSFTENPFSVDGNVLKSSLNRVQFSASNDNSHPILTGVNLRSDGTSLFVQAADGYRLSRTRMMMGIQAFDVTISCLHRNIIALLDGVIDMSIKERQVVLSNGVFTYSTQLIDGNYPELQHIIPTTKNTSIEIEKANLRNAVRRAMVFAKNTDNVIKIGLLDSKLSVYSCDNTGENSMEFDVVSTGNDTEFAVNGKFVLDFLNVASDNIVIELTQPSQPIVFKSVGNDTFTHVVMPMQLGKI